MPKKKADKPRENVSVHEFYESFGERLKLRPVIPNQDFSQIIKEKSINRPALALTGYFKYFAKKRLQLFGAGEMAYLRNLSDSEQEDVLSKIARKRIPCMIVSRNLSPTKAMLNVAKKHKIPLFRTPLKSKDFTAEATVLLEEKMAPRTSLHGTLLDVQGIGILLRGSSGVGKSECALALVERGHSLVTDDTVYMKLLSERELMGRGSKLNRGYLECRGIGIINVAELFGIRSVRLEKRIDLVITFVEPSPHIEEERTGLDQKYYKILNQNVPHVEIPVRPGRDMARLVEVAAMVQALKHMGHNSAHNFNERLIQLMSNKNSEKNTLSNRKKLKFDSYISTNN